ncbi:MAG TPA: ThuA domain-containing protein [Anaerolineales bacterium]|nr:ThuA domain-containing protein [Anaerolineales bacterium]
MKQNEKSILFLLGGMWHDFDGFTNAMKPIFEAKGYRVESTYDLDILMCLDRGNYDVLLSYTCLTKHRPDYDDSGPEKITDDQLLGLTRWMREGGSLLAAHSATVIGDSNPELGRLLGGVFISHPQPFTFTVIPLSGEHPITADLEEFEIHDEFYIQKYDPTVEIHMATLYQGRLHPMVWSRTEGKGRVVHVAPGHFPEVWHHPMYQKLMLQTADWLTET